MEQEYKDAVKNHATECVDYIELVNKLTTPQLTELKGVITKAKNLLKQQGTEVAEVDIAPLQKVYLELSLVLFDMIDKLKYYEVYSSEAKARETEAYNNAYLLESVPGESGKKPSVAELEVRSLLKSKKDSVVSLVYSSALKNIKDEIGAAETVLDTLKNIIKVRTSLEFSSNQIDRISKQGEF